MILDFDYKENYKLDDLLAIMKILRGENGCPWDREQDHNSIRNNFLEETYEVLEAIDLGNVDLLREELGDVLLQVVFHASMEEDAGNFDFDGVCDGICKKLILRHPHIFAGQVAENSDQVLQRWDEIKQQSKGQTTVTETLQSVPEVFPALMYSEKVQKRAAKSGFDYPDGKYAMADLESELLELKEAIAKKDQANIDEELGDLLFSVVNVARFVRCDAESSLKAAAKKFIQRFEKVEQLAKEEGIDMKGSSIAELDILWKKAKRQ